MFVLMSFLKSEPLLTQISCRFHSCVMSVFPSDLVDRCGGRHRLRDLSRVLHRKLRADPSMPILCDSQADNYVDWLLATVRVGSTFGKTARSGIDALPTQRHRNRWIHLQFEACDELALSPGFILPYIHGLCLVLSGIPLPPNSPVGSFKSLVNTPVRSPRCYAISSPHSSRSLSSCATPVVRRPRKVTAAHEISRDSFDVATLDM